MSKVMRLPSAGARLGAPAGQHQAADHTPRGPRLLAAAGAVGGRTHAGKGRAGSGAGSDASQPLRLPASGTDDSTAVSRGRTLHPGAADGQADAPGEPKPSALTGLPEPSNVWSKLPSALSSSPRPSGHLHTSPRGSFLHSPRPPSRAWTVPWGRPSISQSNEFTRGPRL